MPEKILLTLLFSLFLVTSGGPAYAQEPEEDVQPDTPQAEVAPQPEAPKQISTIIIEDNRLSVEFVNINFGDILRSISQKAGFRLEGSSPVFSKKVTTKFTDLDMDTGIIRLFSLAKESNYLISYDEKGSIAKLKLPGAGAGGKTSSYGVGTPGSGAAGAPQTPAMPRGRQRSRMFQRRDLPGAHTPVPQPALPQAARPQAARPQPEDNSENEDAPDE